MDRGLAARARRVRLALGAGLLLAACAPTSVTQVQSYAAGRLPRPDRVLVYDFLVAPGEVTLDHSIVARAVEKLENEPQSDTARAVAMATTDSLSKHLVEQLRTLGFQAERARGAPPGGNLALVHGQFVTIDEGSETTRLVIGLGAGASQVRTRVQLYDTARGSPELLQQFDTQAESTIKPGMLETVGAGALAGRAAVSAGVSAGVGVASEKWRDNPEADAARTASAVAQQLAQVFLEQGWVTSEAVSRLGKPTLP